MAIHKLAGKPAPDAMLINVPRLITDYYKKTLDADDPAHRVSFGTSGHRGTSSKGGFNEAQILTVSQAIAEYRQQNGVTGPLYLGKDTHALSEPAMISAIEVFAANGVELFIQQDGGYTPTPVISRAILTYNQGKKTGFADGVVITPSHNPPEDGGFKYNPPSAGPADTATTKTIQTRANEILNDGLRQVKRLAMEKALLADTTHEIDFTTPYVEDLKNVVDMDAVAAAGLKIGVDPMGGAGIDYWDPIAEQYGLNIEVVNRRVDPTFSFMTIDRDGKIRMDCSSPYAMASLINLREKFDLAFGNDPDYDRHGIVTRGHGLMNPNHYLAVAVSYLFQNRPGWPESAAIGKTLVSSSMIDRVAAHLGKRMAEVPVGFKYFVDGLIDGTFGFGGEESAGASFLRRDGSVWCTDKDGIIMDLLAAEIMAKTERDPAEHYKALEEQFGSPIYERLQAPASADQKNVLKNLSPDMVTASTLAGEEITTKLTHAPGNGAAIGGLKVTTQNGWFAARPSGTEEIYKIYTESFLGEAHLKQIQDEAQEIVSAALKTAGL